MQITCKQCGKNFELTESEREFYEKKGLHIPKRCKECREDNKREANENMRPATSTKQGQSSTYMSKGNNTTKGKLVAWIVAAILVCFGCGKTIAVNVPKTDTVQATETDLQNGVEIQETVQDAPTEALPETIQETIQETVQAETVQAETVQAETVVNTATNYRFRSSKLLNEHYDKHGIEMGFGSAADYEAAASLVINNPNALYKTEKEDGDGVYYVEATNEFVILSTDGYIRTYFNPSGGKKYFDKQ